MKQFLVTTLLSLALTACLAGPDEPTGATSESADEIAGTAYFTVSPNGPQSGIPYRGSQRGPTDPGTCAGNIPIQRVFRFDSESRRYVEIHLTACASDLAGALRPNGRAFDLYLAD